MKFSNAALALLSLSPLASMGQKLRGGKEAKDPFAEGELDRLLEELKQEAEAKFSQSSHRSLSDACDSMVTSPGEAIATAYDFYKGMVDMKKYADLFDRATTIGEERTIANSIKQLPASDILICVAQAADSTISLDYSFDSSVLFLNRISGLSVVFGEEGQFAVAETTGLGVDGGLLGDGFSFEDGLFGDDGVATGVSLSHGPTMGGFDTVAPKSSDPDICFSLGFLTEDGVGAAITFSMNKDAVEENQVIDLVTEALQGNDLEVGEVLDLLLSLPSSGGLGITSVGVEVTGNVEDLDLTGLASAQPDVSIHSCTEELLICDGEGCEDKKMKEALEDGTACVPGLSCDQCENESSFWWSKAFTACGSEPALVDGTRCFPGTTCNACANDSSWWGSKLGFYCGQEPQETEDSEGPCLESGADCRGSSCNNCCAESATCPWHRFGACNCN